MNKDGLLIVISGPSGAGKSTVIKKASAGRDDFCFSVSATTRSPRHGEVDGKDYFFVSKEKFDDMIANNELLEHAAYVANSYGTPRDYVEKQLRAGLNVILDIEVNGAKQIAEKMPECVKIFLVPPSLEELKRRLVSRGTDTESVINSRIERARQEYKEADFYDYLIVNDDADTAAGELLSIISAEHCVFSRNSEYLI